jgi:hypothetical protein
MYRERTKQRFALRTAVIDPTVPVSQITKVEANGKATL